MLELGFREPGGERDIADNARRLVSPISYLLVPFYLRLLCRSSMVFREGVGRCERNWVTLRRHTGGAAPRNYTIEEGTVESSPPGNLYPRRRTKRRHAGEP